MKTIGMKFSCYFLVITLLVLSIAGCGKPVPSYISNPSLAHLTRHQRDLLYRIEHSGIQVIRQGMRFTFVIPTDCFFTKDTYELKSHREKVIENLATFARDYMHYFSHPWVRITGYTDQVWLAPTRDALSLHYAEIIADYLREDGVEPDRVIVNGLGAKEAVAANGYSMGASFNRRVEVMIDD